MFLVVLLVLIPSVDPFIISFMYCHKLFFLLLIFSNHCYLFYSSSLLHYPTLSFVCVFLSSCALPTCVLSPASYFSLLSLLLHPASFCFLSCHLFPSRAAETDGIPILLSRSAALCQVVETQSTEGVVVWMAVS